MTVEIPEDWTTETTETTHHIRKVIELIKQLQSNLTVACYI